MTDQLPARKKRAIRLAFVAMVLGCILQCWITSQVGEPYPSLRMPGFRGNAGYSQGQVNLRQLEAIFVCDEGRVAISQKELFKELPASHLSSLAEKFCKPAELRDRYLLPAGLEKSVWRRLFPGLYAEELKRREGIISPSFRAWLKERADILAPGRRVRRVELTWFEEVIPFHHEYNRSNDRRRLGSLTIPLASDQAVPAPG